MANLLETLRGDSGRRDNSYNGTAGRGIDSGTAPGTGSGTGSFLVWVVVAVWAVLMPLGAMAEEVRGIVRDGETGKPVELAGIEVAAVGAKGANGAASGGNGAGAGVFKGSVGAYTDSLGRFSVGNIAAGDSLRVRVAAFSYEKYDRVVAFPKDSLRIVLNPAGKALGEVTVTAEPVTRIDGGYRIIPSKNQVKHAFGGYGLLYNLMIPGVQVDPTTGAVSAFGAETKLYINGVEASFREVQSLRAKDVARVEYYDTPKGEYAMDRTAINIIMKERDSGGYVEAVGRQTIGYAKGDLDLTAKFFNGNTRYTVFGGAGYGAYSGDESCSRDTIAFPDDPMVRSRRSELDKLRSNSEYLQFQMQNANKKRTLRGDIIFNRDATPTNVTSGETSYSRTGFDNLATSSETSNRSTSGTLKLFGNFHFGKKHHFQANLVFKYGHNTYDYLHTQAEAEEIRSNVKENNYTQRANLRYLWNIDKKNTLSARLLLNNMISDADYSGNVSNTQNMRSTDGRLILSWQFNHGKWSTNLMPGIDVTDYHTKGNKKNSQVLPRLTASVQFQPHKKDFVYLEGVVRTAAPPVSWLSGAVQKVDPVEVRVGNPNLPQTKVYMGTVVYGIGLSKVNLQWYAVYLFQDDSPAYAYCIADDYLMRTMDARAGYHNFVTSLDASWRPTKNLNISAKVGYMYQRDCIPGEPTPTAKAVIYGAKAAYYIGNVAINAKYDSPTQYTSLGAREKTDHTYGISVSYAVGGWQMEVGANNLFLKPTTETWIQSNVYNGLFEMRKKKDMSHGYVRVAYSFDFGKKLKHTNDGPDRSSESAILRAN